MASENKYPKKYCHLHNCSNNKGANKDILLFRIPNEQPIRQQWLNVIRMNQKIDDDVNKNFSICEKHFQECEINRRINSRRKLAVTAVPTILPYKQSNDVEVNVEIAENDGKESTPINK